MTFCIIFLERYAGIDRSVVNLGKLLVEVYHNIGIFLFIGLVGVSISAVVSRKGADGGSVTLVFRFGICIINAGTTCDIQVLRNVIFQIGIEHIAVFCFRTQVAISNPIRILHVHTHTSRLPALFIIPQLIVVAFKIFFTFKIHPSRIEVCPHYGIKVCTEGYHVVVELAHITGGYIQSQFIL